MAGSRRPSASGNGVIFLTSSGTPNETLAATVRHHHNLGSASGTDVGRIVYEIDSSRGWSVDLQNLPDRDVRRRKNIAGYENGADFRLPVTGGMLHLSIDSNFITSRDGQTPPQYLDYMSMGHWLYVPDSGRDEDRAFGTFAFGAPNDFDSGNLAALTGTAGWFGPVKGLAKTGPDVPREFRGVARLSADFEDDTELGRIRGTVSQLTVTDGSDNPIEGNPSLTLTEAEIVPQNRFSGNVSGRSGTTTLSGHWAGRFANGYHLQNRFPNGVLGTFGAASDDDSIGLAGSFITVQDPSSITSSPTQIPPRPTSVPLPPPPTSVPLEPPPISTSTPVRAPDPQPSPPRTSGG